MSSHELFSRYESQRSKVVQFSRHNPHRDFFNLKSCESSISIVIAVLFLGDNNIPNLNFNITCLPKLRYLDLEDNNITKFSQRDLDNFDRVAIPYRNQNFTLEIAGNPLRCDVALKGLYSWLHNTKVRFSNISLYC